MSAPPIEAAPAKPTFAFHCGLLSLAEYHASRRAVELLEARDLWGRLAVGLSLLLMLIDGIAVRDTSVAGLVILAMFAWFIFEPGPGEGRPTWPPTLPAWMLAEHDYFIVDKGVWARSEVDERTILWKEIGLLAESRAGLMFFDWRRRPLIWIPSRAFLPSRSRDGRIATVKRQGVKRTRLRGV